MSFTLAIMLLVLVMNAQVHAAVGGTVHLFGKVMTATDTATDTPVGDGSPRIPQQV